ncbi:UDP-2,4-diacetamido-2,4,6-trideoxy-beta-L-altropyranose hydrolase [Paenibacillus sp. 32O-W]|uniref:UDP-2,4-diacetamido-2,4, 6-trideoxy-beta-L-altropyranose hydrolase n=1 Tax=Paenibacillus sp. 32O-W TaxID=1695218 RepID=UPI00072164EA|nr:UDP-2,4-diacetamido-2,4,6-trideoxy-beta-L-altropyranose hydrolase [Paenibacillus sp. 32O-W]ALS26100.1 UDP-2,4-diacetamido-2,4,6-trideoxy-beta-L-altropyranose hydrolase [Paenibacillus sp. 32O-W]
MKIGVRADASHLIGSGHFMRCLTLAAELLKRGNRVVWFAYEINEYQTMLLKRYGISLVKLEAPGATACIQALASLDVKLDWFIIDHYGWSWLEEQAVSRYVKFIMVIDDLANRKHYCDLLLDQNELDNKDERYKEWISSNTRRLLGSKYALLRYEFYQHRSVRTYKFKEPYTLLISYGGTDPTNETLKALDALESLGSGVKIRADVVIGRNHRYRAQIEKRCRQRDNLALHVQSENMAALMSRSFAALCAGGTTTWERYCLGLPALVTVVADNQLEIAEMGSRAGIDILLGFSNEVDAGRIQQHLELILTEPQQLQKSRYIAQNMVDGKGTSRVVDVLEQMLRERAD